MGSASSTAVADTSGNEGHTGGSGPDTKTLLIFAGIGAAAFVLVVWLFSRK